MKDQFIILSKDDLTDVLALLIREALREEITSLKPDDNSPLLTREEAANILDISLPTLNQWEKDGSIPKLNG